MNKKTFFSLKIFIKKLYTQIETIQSKEKIFFLFINSWFRNLNLKVGKNLFLNQYLFISGEGSIKIGNNCTIGYKKGGYFRFGYCEFQARYPNSKILLGNNIKINNNLFICCAKEIVIGNKVLIGEGVMFIDHDGHGINPEERLSSIGKMQAIRIEDNVWIGSRVTILKGTQVGKNSIIGAGSVVKGNFAENVIISGNPARIIKEIKVIK